MSLRIGSCQFSFTLRDCVVAVFNGRWKKTIEIYDSGDQERIFNDEEDEEDQPFHICFGHVKNIIRRIQTVVLVNNIDFNVV